MQQYCDTEIMASSWQRSLYHTTFQTTIEAEVHLVSVKDICYFLLHLITNIYKIEAYTETNPGKYANSSHKEVQYRTSWQSSNRLHSCHIKSVMVTQTMPQNGYQSLFQD